MKNQKGLIIGVIIFALVMVLAVFAYNRLSQSYTPPETSPDTVISESDADSNTAKSPEESNVIRATDFTVEDGVGNSVSLYSFKGKPIVVNFWATWCGPCKSELPAFEKAYKTYGDEVEFMMVNLTDGQRETIPKVKEFIGENGYTFPVYYDTKYSASATYGISSIPATLFVDADGNVYDGRLGAMNENTLFRLIDGLIGG